MFHTINHQGKKITMKYYYILIRLVLGFCFELRTWHLLGRDSFALFFRLVIMVFAQVGLRSFYLCLPRS
jgi:hypothetical protein